MPTSPKPSAHPPHAHNPPATPPSFPSLRPPRLCASHLWPTIPSTPTTYPNSSATPRPLLYRGTPSRPLSLRSSYFALRNPPPHRSPPQHDRKTPNARTTFRTSNPPQPPKTPPARPPTFHPQPLSPPHPRKKRFETCRNHAETCRKRADTHPKLRQYARVLCGSPSTISFSHSPHFHPFSLLTHCHNSSHCHCLQQIQYCHTPPTNTPQTPYKRTTNGPQTPYIYPTNSPHLCSPQYHPDTIPTQSAGTAVANLS